LRSGGLTNNGSMTFTGGVTTVNGAVTNAVGRVLQVSNNTTTFTGQVVNNGKFKNSGATVTFAAGYTENGTYISDPADNYFTDLTVGLHGSLSGSTGDRFIVSGNLVSDSVENRSWQTAAAELRFAGGSGIHNFSINGTDLGATLEGYRDDFAWGTLRLAASEHLTLLDSGLPGGALYTGNFVLESGLGQIASINSNGLNIYYDASRATNAYLGQQTYALSGGGFLTPVPEPGVTALLASCVLLGLGRLRRQRG
jgi:hypothetical protein